MSGQDKDKRYRILQHNLLRMTRLLAKPDRKKKLAIQFPEAEEAPEEIDPFSPDYVEPSRVSEETAYDGKKKGKAAVICWDLGHNPTGRAIVLYDLLKKEWDVDLIGPLWTGFGGEIWPPIQKSDRKIRSLVCETLNEFWPAANAFAETNAYDLIVVCKPRAPSLALGALIKKHSQCPMVLDVDDLELTFADSDKPVSEADIKKHLTDAFRLPYESMAIRYCDKLVSDADSIIVSNVENQNLMNRFESIHL